MAETRAWRWVAVPVLVGALVSLSAGLLARHEPRSKGYFRLFFSDPVHLKAGFATAAVILACFQLFTAAWIFRRLPWQKPAWVNPAHRWSGRVAVLLTLPAAYHCIFKLGFATYDARAAIHSALGAAFYGALFAKVFIVRSSNHPGWSLPMAGATLFAILTLLWFTSAFWMFSAMGVSL